MAQIVLLIVFIFLGGLGLAAFQDGLKEIAAFLRDRKDRQDDTVAAMASLGTRQAKGAANDCR